MQGLGILVLLVGLRLRAPTTLVVLLSALVTGLAAGMNPLAFLEILGRSFVDHRMLTLFLLTLPAVGLCERHGLREQAAAWVARLPSARVSGILLGYHLVRLAQGALGLRMSGHSSFVRPLVAPMCLASSPGRDPQKLQAMTAACENYANFYGQNLSVVAPGLLMVYGLLKGQGFPVPLWQLAAWACLPVGLSLALATWQFSRQARA